METPPREGRAAAVEDVPPWAANAREVGTVIATIGLSAWCCALVVVLFLGLRHRRGSRARSQIVSLLVASGSEWRAIDVAITTTLTENYVRAVLCDLVVAGVVTARRDEGNTLFSAVGLHRLEGGPT